VIATTSAVMMLYDKGLLDLDAPVARYLPEWLAAAGCTTDDIVVLFKDAHCDESAKAKVTVRQLLTHSAGLQAWGAVFNVAHGREQYIRRIASLPLEYAPGTRTLYSDFSMILMQAIIERLTGETLDMFVARRLFEPIGMRDTRFTPLRTEAAPDSLGCLAGVSRDPALLARIAPTSINSRGEQLHGTVHDENACALGGVSGHAGLFSSARDLAVFAQMLLNDGFYGAQRYIEPGTIDLFTSRQEERSSRGLGWDTPAVGASQGDYFSEHSFGHTGFTGTSLWVDKERDLFVVLLTNRVNPDNGNERHLALRLAVHNAIALAITDVPVAKRPEVVQHEKEMVLKLAALRKAQQRAKHHKVKKSKKVTRRHKV
jgi:CubicO group peptidase (beta-lactamase class C family)